MAAQAQVKKDDQNQKTSGGTVSVTVPVIRTGKYVSTRLDMHLPTEHAQRLRDIVDGLNSRNAKLKSGKFVEQTQHAILYLLENFESTPIVEK